MIRKTESGARGTRAAPTADDGEAASTEGRPHSVPAMSATVIVRLSVMRLPSYSVVPQYQQSKGSDATGIGNTPRTGTPQEPQGTGDPRSGGRPLDGAGKTTRLPGTPSHSWEHVSELHGRYAAYAAALRDGVLGPAGQTPADLRRAVMARAAQLGGKTDRTEAATVPPTLAGYVDKVARHAYKVTDEDLAGLLRAGNSEDAL